MNTMKKIKIWALLALIGLGTIAQSCDKEPKTDDPTTQSSAVLEGEIIGSRTLSADTTYLLKGFVYIVDGAQLTIPAGTILKGDKETKATLVVERGGKIFANGTANAPIVFTSNQAAGQRDYGDWGGIIMCGKARINTTGGTAKIEGGPRSEYGGNDDNDNSGSITYCRIEFAGVEYQTDNEINGLTMGGVGQGTTLHHIQVSFCGDDSFEWFGGNVNCKNLVAFRGWDDEFDTDAGYNGTVQFAIGFRDKNVADKSKSNGFESDNDKNGTDNGPMSNPKFSNVTLFGPYQSTNDFSFEPTGGNGAFQAAMHLKKNTKLQVYNSVFVGWPVGLFIDKENTQANATNGDLVVKNCVMTTMKENFNADFDNAYFNREGGNNSIAENIASLGISNLNYTNPQFQLNSGSSLLNGADFNGTSTFQTVSFVGAFGAENWTAGWCNFDPQNTVY